MLTTGPISSITLTLLACIAMTASAVAGEFEYRYGNDRVALEITSRIVVTLNPGSPSEAYPPFAADPRVLSVVLDGNRATLVLADHLSQTQIADFSRALSSNPDVESCSPVFRYRNAEHLAKPELLLVLDDPPATGWASFAWHEHQLELIQLLPGSSPIAWVRYAGCTVDVFDQCARCERLPFVRNASPNFIYIRATAGRPDDAHFDLQWSHENTGQDGGTPRADAGSLHAFNMSIDASGVVIAVIDDGVDVDHPDLAANMLVGYDATDQPSPSGVPGRPLNDDPHGTACAGVAAAIGDNGIGVAGMAWSAKILPVRVGYGTYWTEAAWVVDAITWAADNGADVLSCSWGDVTPSAAHESAIDYARDVGRGGLGCVVVFSSQNGDVDVAYPAAYSNTIAVGASSPCDERKSPSSCDGETAWGSNHGPELTLVAPGVHIPTTDLSGLFGFSLDDYYVDWGGTSSAAPLVSGAVALLLAVDPTLTVAEVESRLMMTSADRVGPPSEDTVGFDEYMGWGRLDVGRLLATAWPTTRLIGSDVISTAGSIVSYNVRAHSDEPLDALTFGAVYPDGPVDLIDVEPGSALESAEFFAIQMHPADSAWSVLVQFSASDPLPASQEAWIASAVFEVSSGAATGISRFEFPALTGDSETPTVFFGSAVRVPNLEPGRLQLLTSVGTFIRGDANDDGAVDITDVLVLLGYLFQDGPLPCADGADLDDDGAVQFSDVFSLLGHLFGAAPAPPDPWPLPSGDPTADVLGC